jgi:SnoaL-like domain
MTAKEIVLEFHRHFAEKDWDALRPLLAADLHFSGPIDQFTDAEAYLQAVRRLEPLLQRVEIQNVLAEGPDVCVLWKMVTDTPIGTVSIAEFYRVEGRVISRIQILFDPRPFLAMLPAPDRLAGST